MPRQQVSQQTGALPVIGITPRTEERANNNGPAVFAQTSIMEALSQVGAIPVVLGETADPSVIETYLGLCDGFLFPGGEDVDPAVYGQARSEACGPSRPERDAFEAALLRAAVAADKPLLGICRGNQMLNVALGGTLVQDIPTQLAAGNPLAHDQRFPFDTLTHTVEVATGTLLERVMGGHAFKAPGPDGLPAREEASDAPGWPTVWVNTLHHQSVERVAEGLLVNAYAPDGVVEGLEMPGKRFVLSVQWHPESLWQNDEAWLCLFGALADAAREDRAARTEPDGGC